MPNIDEAIEALLAYRQADMEGVMVLTSRQAIHEVADELKRLREPARSSAGNGSAAASPLAYRLDHPTYGIDLSIRRPAGDWTAAGWTVTPLYGALAQSRQEPCEYCGNGQRTGLPGNACENCMNTGLKYPQRHIADAKTIGEWEVALAEAAERIEELEKIVAAQPNPDAIAAILRRHIKLDWLNASDGHPDIVGVYEAAEALCSLSSTVPGGGK